MKKNIFHHVIILLSFAFINIPYFSNAQAPACDASVPYYFIDLTGKPAGTWISPSIARNGKCCGASGSDNCISFEIKTDANAAQVSFDVNSGAMPTGALYYQIDCGTQVPVGQKICLSGIGPHRITFCKPGNNENTYILTSYPRPVFPSDTTVRIGCNKTLPVLGITAGSVTWTSVYPGTTGQYDSYLSCTNCLSPSFTPIDGAPAYIDYKICGFPEASTCGLNFTVCDTVRIFINSRLTGTVSPSPALFCATSPGSGVTLTATPAGGTNSYTYIWRNSSLDIVGNAKTYFANAQGNYTVEIRDGLYNNSTCPSTILNATVTQAQLPVVNAGADQTVCTVDARVNLNGSVANASGATWSGGNGTFSPGPDNLTPTYWPTNSELASGSLKLTLTSNNSGDCPLVSDDIIITFPSPLQAAMSSGAAACSGSINTLNVSASGGIAPYSYSWNTGSSSTSISAPPGTYCVTVTDNLGCNSTVCKTVTAPSLLSISMSSTNLSVNGGSDGTATATVSGGSSPYFYLWSNNSTTATITGLTYGVYTVTVHDSKGCTINGSVVVNEPRCLGLNISANHTDLACYGNSNASATAFATGGSAPYSYVWNDNSNQKTAQAINLSGGTYTVIVTDATSCISSTSVTIATPPPIINTFTYSDVTNFTGNNGSATANPYGGTPAYAYSWGNGAGTQTISNLTPGIYHLNITDSKGCLYQDSVLINKDSCSNLRTSVVSTALSCFGSGDGGATAFVNIGKAPFQYLWSNGATTNSISGLSSGMYSVRIIDSTGCFTLESFNVAEPAKLSLGLSPTDVICNSQNNGTIETTVSGGTYPYNFNWSNGSNTEDLIYLAPANYTVNILDAKGCGISDSVIINQPTALTTGYTTKNPTCNGASDGSIDLTVSGGMVPYSYLWSNGTTGQDLSAISAGSYIVKVTDANDCKLSSDIDIILGQPGVVTVDSVIIPCSLPGSGKTTVTVIASGGNGGPYQISFDNGTTFMAPGQYNAELSVDTIYQVIVKDSNNCASPAAYSLSINPGVKLQSVSFSKCFPADSANTSVNVVPSGGDGGPYRVSFDNGATFEASGSYIKNLPVGASYFILAKDQKGCISAKSSIQIPAPLSASITSGVYNGGFNVSCNGNSDGSVTTSVTGGTQPFSFSWNGPENYTSNLQSIAGVNAGIYSVTVTDTNGCTVSKSITLTQPDSLSALAASPVVSGGFNISCNGANNGSINLSVAGGDSATYTFGWTGPAGFTSNTKSITGLGAGIYNLTLSDANGCTASKSITLTQPDSLSALAVSPVVSGGFNISCNGANNGSINLSVAGGDSATYTYSWTGPSGFTANTKSINGLGAGNYNLVVTDANGCKATTGIAITKPDSMAINLSPNFYHLSNVTCKGRKDGAIIINVTGGDSTSYRFSWSGPNGYSSKNKNINSLFAGTYNLSVADSNGCASVASVQLIQPDSLISSATAASNYNGNAISCAGKSDGMTSLTITGGTMPYSFSWSNGGTAQNLTGLVAGNYGVTVTDANGCQTTSAVTLTEPQPIFASVSMNDVRCNGFSTGSIDLTISGGVNPYTHAWSNGNTSEDLSNLNAGNYSAIITDGNQCTYFISASVNETSPVILSISSTNETCFENNNGTAQANVAGGTMPYSIAWSNGNTSAGISGLEPGSYSVTVTDSNGCYKSDTIVIDQPSSLIASVSSPLYPNGHNVSLFQSADGSVQTDVKGGTAPYLYSWSNGAATKDLSQIPAGNYAVVITDTLGCRTTVSITLSQPNDLAMPTGFSPNSDGQNDFFIVHGLESYPNNKIVVVNRWGNTVFKAEPYRNNWNGLNTSGEEIPDGTYFVVLTINGGEIILKGYVDVRR
jgi:gliding motility-associated-like protein